MKHSKINPTSDESLESIFAQAIEIDSLEERHAFIEQTCGRDVELRKNVEELVQAHLSDDVLLDASEDVVDSIIPQSTMPDSFGEFEVIREIGRGGMGVVYEARQASLNRLVALKVLTVGLNFSKTSIARFQREAESAARLCHTNIVPIYTSGVQNQNPYYAMELIRGPSLDAVLEQVRRNRSAVHAVGSVKRGSVCDASPVLPSETGETVALAHSETLADSSLIETGADYFNTIARMIAEVADALHHAHEEGVLHRDIKPSNLLLGPDRRLHVSDFGLARVVDEPSVTVTGELLGTPRYMSPEQISCKSEQVDPRTDVYSLGVTLYEMLTLERAFDGDSREQVVSQVLNKQPIPPRRIQAKIPVDLETICQKAMAKLPSDRYQRAADLAEDLRRFIDRKAIIGKRIGWIGHTVRWSRRNRPLAAACMLFAVALVLGLSSVAWHRIEQWRHWALTESEIEAVIETDPWVARLRIEKALKRFPDRHSELMSVRKSIGREIGIETETPGVEIAVRPRRFKAGEEWLSLGTTELRTNLPLDHYHVRVKLAGRDELIVTRNTLWELADPWRVPLPTRSGLVQVTRTRVDDDPTSRRIFWLMNRRIPPSIPAFKIDRHEVTNAQFKQFVDAGDRGGYYDEKHWFDTLGKYWKDVVIRFTDADGDRGPSQWRDGSYPPGLDDHPVVGISWYEAMAYAKWANKQLPTIYHWLWAADYNGWAPDIDRDDRYNIGGRRLTHRSVHDGWRSANQFGVRDMHGNVREWCLNEMNPGTHYAMGGSWLDEDGSGYDPVGIAAMERRPDVGFRCAVYEPNPAWAAAMPVQWREAPNEAKTMPRKYAEQFRFKRKKPWNASPVDQVTFHGVAAQRVQFDAAYGNDQRITSYVILPDRQEFAPPYQVMLGTSPIFLDDQGNPRIDESRFSHYQPLIRGGRALVLPTLCGLSHDRQVKGFDPYHVDPQTKQVYVDTVVKMAQDVTRTVDFFHQKYPELAGNNVLDLDRLVFVSCACFQSECLIVADKLVTKENRFAAAFFVLGGIRNDWQPAAVDQLTYLPHLDTPTIVINWQRRLLPREFSLDGMMDLLPLPPNRKKLLAIPGWEWSFPQEHLNRELCSWLNQLETLGPPQARNDRH